MHPQQFIEQCLDKYNTKEINYYNSLSLIS